jgi:hypothetical protein
MTRLIYLSARREMPRRHYARSLFLRVLPTITRSRHWLSSDVNYFAAFAETPTRRRQSRRRTTRDLACRGNKRDNVKKASRHFRQWKHDLM